MTPLCLRVMGGNLPVVSVYAPTSRSEYTAFMEPLNGVLHGAPVGDSIGLLY